MYPHLRKICSFDLKSIVPTYHQILEYVPVIMNKTKNITHTIEDFHQMSTAIRTHSSLFVEDLTWRIKLVGVNIVNYLIHA